MFVESIQLNNYRNYDSADVTFSPGVNIFYGNNSAGAGGDFRRHRHCPGQPRGGKLRHGPYHRHHGAALWGAALCPGDTQRQRGGQAAGDAAHRFFLAGRSQYDQERAVHAAEVP